MNGPEFMRYKIDTLKSYALTKAPAAKQKKRS